jgi:hypothetical protein
MIKKERTGTMGLSNLGDLKKDTPRPRMILGTSHIYPSLFTYKCIFIYTYINTYVYMYIHIHPSIHTYIHVCNM